MTCGHPNHGAAEHDCATFLSVGVRFAVGAEATREALGLTADEFAEGLWSEVAETHRKLAASREEYADLTAVDQGDDCQHGRTLTAESAGLRCPWCVIDELSLLVSGIHEQLRQYDADDELNPETLHSMIDAAEERAEAAEHRLNLASNAFAELSTDRDNERRIAYRWRVRAETAEAALAAPQAMSWFATAQSAEGDDMDHAEMEEL